MSTLSSVRDIASPGTPSFSFGRAVALLAGTLWSVRARRSPAAELARSRRQLAQLDDRLLRDIGLDRGTARVRSHQRLLGLIKASGLGEGIAGGWRIEQVGPWCFHGAMTQLLSRFPPWRSLQKPFPTPCRMRRSCWQAVQRRDRGLQRPVLVLGPDDRGLLPAVVRGASAAQAQRRLPRLAGSGRSGGLPRLQALQAARLAGRCRPQQAGGARLQAVRCGRLRHAAFARRGRAQGRPDRRARSASASSPSSA